MPAKIYKMDAHQINFTERHAEWILRRATQNHKLIYNANATPIEIPECNKSPTGTTYIPAHINVRTELAP